MVFVETPIFTEQVVKLWSDDELAAMQAHLVEHPNAGDVIPKSGGLRKLRWSLEREGKGKQGGVRVIYYRFVAHERILLILIYPKSSQEDLTPSQIKTLRALVEQEYHSQEEQP